MDPVERDTPRIFILSEAPGRLNDGANRLFPEAEILVPQHRVPQFNAVGFDDRLVPYPSTCTTRSAVYAHVLKEKRNDVIVFVDDGVTAVECITGWTPVKYGRGTLDLVLTNLVTAARATGSPVFGMRAEPHAKAYTAFDPLSFKKPIGGELIGFIGRSVPLEAGYHQYDGLYVSAAAWGAGKPVYCDSRFRMVGVEREAVSGVRAEAERALLCGKFPGWLQTKRANDGGEQVVLRKRKATKHGTAG